MDEWTNAIHCGDSFELLDELPAESIHAVVTDPPYGLNFMGKDWDNFRRRNNPNDVSRDNVGGRLSAKAPASGAETDGKRYQAWCEGWAAKALRVLKPGGHLLAFSGTRTYHRLACGIEDAGFEIRDKVDWLYGSGFPKALDVSKAIDKAAGAEREVVGPKSYAGHNALDLINPDEASNNRHEGYNRPWLSDPEHVKRQRMETRPATDAAREWDGWKTALKPAHEPICLARKPFDGTVAETVQAHGTGALNIDGCRIEYNGRADLEGTMGRNPGRDDRFSSDVYGGDQPQQVVNDTGRYPANVIFDAEAAAALDREVGDTGGGEYRPAGSSEHESQMFDPDDGWNQHSMDRDAQTAPENYGGSGGPSRYFYTSKASRAERTLDGRIDNPHPTVKPVDLMEWLVTLVTAEGQIVLDPFAGTGTTCRAAKNLNRRFVGMEQDARWADVARVRCGLAPEDPAHVRGDADQSGLEAWADGGST